MPSRPGAAVLLALSCAACERDEASKPSAAPPAVTASPPASEPSVEPRSTPRKPFSLSPRTRSVIAASPELGRRVRRHPHAYYRLFAEEVTERACQVFRPVRRSTPLVNIHGDAHVEQFAVTQRAHGLEDFDHGGFGPGVVDLLRFAASVRLACHDASFSCGADAVVAAFLDAYRRELGSPSDEADELPIVDRLRAEIPATGPAFLEACDGLMISVSDPEIDGHIRARFASFVKSLASTPAAAALGSGKIVAYGMTRVGIGSADEVKYLFRVDGPTVSPDDDLILEWKAVHEAASSCVVHPVTGGMFLPILPALRIGRTDPVVAAHVPHSAGEDTNWWVRSWEDGYRELRIEDLESEADLVAVVRDAGRQLGRGHCVDIADPLEAELRKTAVAAFDEIRSAVEAEAKRVAQEVLAAWRVFRASTPEPEGP